MNLDHWKQIEPILNHVLTLETPQERTRYIRRHCPDEQLRAEIESLLESIESSQHMWEGLLESNQVLVENMSREDFHAHKETLPEQIGSYRIEKRIGRGGMGDVYLGARAGADFHKQVAVKVLRKDATDQNQVQRFLQERSLLSRLNHPNIARLLDGGITKDGRPFIVMEYVDGVPLTEYCTQHNCNVEQRLELFIQACKAVHAAHTNFIVHRDLKPSNLLVTEDGVVKVLDFGIAKLLDQELSEQEVFETRKGNRIFSLNYAAPEQISLEPVTTATDVYALGLLLYELLTTERPFDYKNIKLAEAEKIILNQDPKLPSSVARGHASALRGDLDAIIMKALRKEPGQRYSSALTLMEEIERYLKHQPVYARKGTLKYRTGKYLRRHNLALGIISVFILLAGLFTVYHVNRITQERKIAEQEAEKARRVTGFLAGIFKYANPYENPQSDMTILEVLRYGKDYIQHQIEDEAEVKPILLYTVGGIYETLGEYNMADSLLTESLNLMESKVETASENEYNIAVAYNNLGSLKSSQGKYTEAVDYLQKASEIFNKLNRQSYRAGSMNLWGWTEFLMGNYSKADSLLKKTLTLNLLYDGKNSIATANTLNNMAWLQDTFGNLGKSDSLLSEVLRIRNQVYPGSHPDIATTLHSIAWNHYQMKNYEKAVEFSNKAIAMRKEIFGDIAHPDIAWSLNNLGVIKQAQGKLDESEKYLHEALTIRKEVLPKNHPYIAQTMGNLGSLHYYRKEYDKAAKVFAEVVEVQRAAYGPEHPNVAMSLNNLATVLYNGNRPYDAIPHYEEALSIQVERLGKAHTNSLRMRDNLADVFEDIEEFKKAETLRLTNFELVNQEKGISHKQTQLILSNVIKLYEKWGDNDKVNYYQQLVVSN